MAATLSHRSSIENAIVNRTIQFTFVIYLFGLTYVVGSLIGWALFAVLALRYFYDAKLKVPAVSPIVFLWMMGMIIMLIALLVAHLTLDLGVGQTVKSSIGWMKGWALLALFLFLGNVLKLEKASIVRSCCILSMQAIPFSILGIMAYFVGHNGDLFVSPLSVVGGPMETFQVKLFGLNPETGLPRWSYFTPWAPAAGLVGCLLFVFCLEEKNRKYQLLGIIGCLTMIVLCQSRAGWVILVFIVSLKFATLFIRDGLVILSFGLVATSVVLFGQTLFDEMNNLHKDIKESRPESTRVRAELADLALQNWEHGQPIWGHGIVRSGPKSVEFMPIGSHHTWYGLLYVKGAIGFLALFVPLALMVIYFLWLSLILRIHAPLLICVIMVIYSFFENLEILVYLYWPALLWLGIHLNPIYLHDKKIQEKLYA